MGLTNPNRKQTTITLNTSIKKTAALTLNTSIKERKVALLTLNSTLKKQATLSFITQISPPELIPSAMGHLQNPELLVDMIDPDDTSQALALKGGTNLLTDFTASLIEGGTSKVKIALPKAIAPSNIEKQGERIRAEIGYDGVRREIGTYTVDEIRYDLLSDKTELQVIGYAIPDYAERSISLALEDASLSEILKKALGFINVEIVFLSEDFTVHGWYVRSETTAAEVVAEIAEVFSLSVYYDGGKMFFRDRVDLLNGLPAWEFDTTKNVLSKAKLKRSDIGKNTIRIIGKNKGSGVSALSTGDSLRYDDWIVNGYVVPSVIERSNRIVNAGDFSEPYSFKKYPARASFFYVQALDKDFSKLYNVYNHFSTTQFPPTVLGVSRNFQLHGDPQNWDAQGIPEMELQAKLTKTVDANGTLLGENYSELKPSLFQKIKTDKTLPSSTTAYNVGTIFFEDVWATGSPQTQKELLDGVRKAVYWGYTRPNVGSFFISSSPASYPSSGLSVAEVKVEGGTTYDAIRIMFAQDMQIVRDSDTLFHVSWWVLLPESRLNAQSLPRYNLFLQEGLYAFPFIDGMPFSQAVSFGDLKVNMILNPLFQDIDFTSPVYDTGGHQIGEQSHTVAMNGFLAVNYHLPFTVNIPSDKNVFLQFDFAFVPPGSKSVGQVEGIDVAEAEGSNRFIAIFKDQQSVQKHGERRAKDIRTDLITTAQTALSVARKKLEWERVSRYTTEFETNINPYLHPGDKMELSLADATTIATLATRIEHGFQSNQAISKIASGYSASGAVKHIAEKASKKGQQKMIGYVRGLNNDGTVDININRESINRKNVPFSPGLSLKMKDEVVVLSLDDDPSNLFIVSKTGGVEGAKLTADEILLTIGIVAPTLSATSQGAIISLSWGAITNAVEYEVFLVDSITVFQTPGLVTPLGKTMTTYFFYEPTKAGSYAFAVKAIDTDGYRSDYSNIASLIFGELAEGDLIGTLT